LLLSKQAANIFIVCETPQKKRNAYSLKVVQKEQVMLNKVNYVLAKLYI